MLGLALRPVIVAFDTWGRLSIFSGCLQKGVKLWAPEPSEGGQCLWGLHAILTFWTVLSALYVAAIQGSIGSVLHNEQVGETEVSLEVSKILHQSHEVFTSSPSSSAGSLLYTETDRLLSRGKHRLGRNARRMANLHNNELQSPNQSEKNPGGQNMEMLPRANSGPEPSGTVIAPHKCKIRPSMWGSEDKFLFLGKIRLQRAILQCAPRLEDFDRIWSDAVREGTNPCTLEWKTTWSAPVAHCDRPVPLSRNPIPNPDLPEYIHVYAGYGRISRGNLSHRWKLFPGHRLLGVDLPHHAR